MTPNGDAFFTDSQAGAVSRLRRHERPAGQRGLARPERHADQYQQGFNLNGIATTSDGAYLIVVQSNTGKLFRISTASKAVVEINLGGQTVTNGDGILLDGRTLYVVRNQNSLIVKITPGQDFASGTVASSTGDATLAYPTDRQGRRPAACGELAVRQARRQCQAGTAVQRREYRGAVSRAASGLKPSKHKTRRIF